MIRHTYRRTPGGRRLESADVAALRAIQLEADLSDDVYGPFLRASTESPSIEAAIAAMTDPNGIEVVADVAVELTGNTYGREHVLSSVPNMQTSEGEEENLGNGRTNPSQRWAIADSESARLDSGAIVWWPWPDGEVYQLPNVFYTDAHPGPTPPAAPQVEVRGYRLAYGGHAEEATNPAVGVRGRVVGGQYGINETKTPTSRQAFGTGLYASTWMDYVDELRGSTDRITHLWRWDYGATALGAAGLRELWIDGDATTGFTTSRYRIGPSGERRFTVSAWVIARGGNTVARIGALVRTAPDLAAAAAGTGTVTRVYPASSPKRIVPNSSPSFYPRVPLRLTAEIVVTGTPGSLVTGVLPILDVNVDGNATATGIEVAAMQAYAGSELRSAREGWLASALHRIASSGDVPHVDQAFYTDDTRTTPTTRRVNRIEVLGELHSSRITAATAEVLEENKIPASKWSTWGAGATGFNAASTAQLRPGGAPTAMSVNVAANSAHMGMRAVDAIVLKGGERITYGAWVYATAALPTFRLVIGNLILDHYPILHTRSVGAGVWTYVEATAIVPAGHNGTVATVWLDSGATPPGVSWTMFVAEQAGPWIFAGTGEGAGRLSVPLDRTYDALATRVRLEEVGSGEQGRLILVEVDPKLVEDASGDVVSFDVEWQRESDPASSTSPVGNYEASTLSLTLDDTEGKWNPARNTDLDVGHRMTVGSGVRYSNRHPNPTAEADADLWTWGGALGTTSTFGRVTRETGLSPDFPVATGVRLSTVYDDPVAGSALSPSLYAPELLEVLPGDEITFGVWVDVEGPEGLAVALIPQWTSDPSETYPMTGLRSGWDSDLAVPGMTWSYALAGAGPTFLTATKILPAGTLAASYRLAYYDPPGTPTPNPQTGLLPASITATAGRMEIRRNHTVAARNLSYPRIGDPGAGALAARTVFAEGYAWPFGGKLWTRVGPVTVSGANGIIRNRLNVADLVDGQTYTTSVEVANPSLSSSIKISLDWCDLAFAGPFTLAPGESRRISVTGMRADYDATYRFADLDCSAEFLFREWLVVEGAVDRPYFDGSSSSSRWTGTPYASTSELLTGGVLDVREEIFPAGVFYSEPFETDSDADEITLEAVDRLVRVQDVDVDEPVRVGQTVEQIVRDLALRHLDWDWDQVEVHDTIADLVIPYAYPSGGLGTLLADIAKAVGGTLHVDAFERLVIAPRDDVTEDVAAEIRDDRSLISFRRPPAYDVTTSIVTVAGKAMSVGPLETLWKLAEGETITLPARPGGVGTYSSTRVVAEYESAPAVNAFVDVIGTAPVGGSVGVGVPGRYNANRAIFDLTNSTTAPIVVDLLYVTGNPLVESPITARIEHAPSLNRYGPRELAVEAKLAQTTDQTFTLADELLASFRSLTDTGVRRLPDLVLRSLGLLHLEAGDRVIVVDPDRFLAWEYGVLGRKLTYSDGMLLLDDVRVREIPLDDVFAYLDRATFLDDGDVVSL